MYKIIAIGDVVLDTHVKIDEASVECDIDGKRCKLCFDYAAKVPVTDSFQTVGGNAANLAFGTAKLGLQTTIISTVGNDSNGKIIKDELTKSKINIDLIYSDNREKTRYSIVLNFKGERTILSYHKKRNYQWPKEIPATDWIYFTSLSEGFEPLQKKMMSFLDKHPSVRLAYNPGSFQLKNNLELSREIAAHCDLLILNLEEAELVAGINYKKTKAITGLIHKLLQIGAKEVIITDAARGAWAGNIDEIWHHDSFDVPIISKTGAGDSFAAGYLSAKIYNHNIPICLSWGIANSCAVIGHFGVQNGLLDKNGINKMIKQFPKILPQKL